MRKSLALVGAVGLLMTFVLSGCEMTKGAGKDIKSAGQGIQNTANDAEH